MRTIINKIIFLRYVLSHPLNKGKKIAALLRYLRWQIGSRISIGAVAVDYVNDSRLLVLPGMTGATLNIYTGLHEFEDMAFVLHALRKEDVFVDVGANIGSYSILAGSAVGARCISIEPIPSTFANLKDNINLNDISDRITALNIGVGENEGEIKFTSNLDTVNHVIAESEKENTEIINIKVKKLDDILKNIEPKLIKIDVEGFETNVIKGAHNTLTKDSLLGVIMELNGSGGRYGFDENTLHELMLSYGFRPYRYLPFDRTLSAINGKNCDSGNTLYLKNEDELKILLKDSPKYDLKQVSVEI